MNPPAHVSLSQGAARGITAAVAAAVIWGSTFVVTKDALADFGPMSLTAGRFVVAYVALLPLAYAAGYRPRMSLERRFATGGLVGVAACFGLQNIGLALTSAAAAGVIIGFIPALTSVLGVLVLGERVSGRQAIGLALAVCGVVLVVGADFASGMTPLLGNLAIFGSAVAWAWYTVSNRHIAHQTPAVVATTAAIGFGLVPLAVLALGEAVVDPPRVGWGAVWALMYLGVGASAVGLVLWNHALAHLTTVRIAPFVNIVPVAALGFAWLAGEVVTAVQGIGAVVIIGGVVLAAPRDNGHDAGAESAQPTAAHRDRDATRCRRS